MSFFDDALNNLEKLEEDVLGPDYNYFKFNVPDDLDMSLMEANRMELR